MTNKIEQKSDEIKDGIVRRVKVEDKRIINEEQMSTNSFLLNISGFGKSTYQGARIIGCLKK